MSASHPCRRPHPPPHTRSRHSRRLSLHPLRHRRHNHHRPASLLHRLLLLLLRQGHGLDRTYSVSRTMSCHPPHHHYHLLVLHYHCFHRRPVDRPNNSRCRSGSLKFLSLGRHLPPFLHSNRHPHF